MSQAAKNTYYLYKHQIKPIQQHFKKFLVLDFEATCEKHSRISPQEIIEFPCLSVDVASFAVEDKFHQYVKPKVHSISTFCTELTGISPCTVEKAPEFSEVFETFLKWLQHQQRNITPEEMIFVTCGNWDLKMMLPEQCAMYNLQIPPIMRRWINLKAAFYHHTGYFPRSLVEMHERLDIVFSGRLHSGIDDCYSILRILSYLGKKGLIFTETDRI